MNTLIIEVVDYIDAGITGAITSFVAHEASIALDDIYTRNQIVKVEANIDHPLIIYPSIRHSYRATEDDSLKLDFSTDRKRLKKDSLLYPPKIIGRSSFASIDLINLPFEPNKNDFPPSNTFARNFVFFIFISNDEGYFFDIV